MLLPSAYLPPVWYFAQLCACDGHTAQVECCDHYAGQTYRNRCYIAGADGPLSLTIPVVKGTEPKTLMRDVRISDHGHWHRQHWNALTTAYASSPFFLYYEDDFRPFYEHPCRFLYDFNLALTELCCHLIDLHPQLLPTTAYTSAGARDDWRECIRPGGEAAMNTACTCVPYWQVSAHRLGFLPGLSIVDLLFNMGPESIFVLQKSINA